MVDKQQCRLTYLIVLCCLILTKASISLHDEQDSSNFSPGIPRVLHTQFRRPDSVEDLRTYSKTYTRRSDIECALECSKDTTCLAFHFNRAQRQCLLASTDRTLGQTHIYTTWLFRRVQVNDEPRIDSTFPPFSFASNVPVTRSSIDTDSNSNDPATTYSYSNDLETTDSHSNNPVTTDSQSNIFETTDSHSNDLETKDSYSNDVETTDSYSNDVETTDSHSNVPETTDSHSNDPESSDSYTNDLETTDSYTNDLDTTDSHSNIPETSDSHNNVPETTDSHSNVPETTDSHSNDVVTTDSYSNDLETTDPYSNDLEATDSHSNNPVTTDSQSTIFETTDSHSNDVVTTDSYSNDLETKDSYSNDVETTDSRSNNSVTTDSQSNIPETTDSPNNVLETTDSPNNVLETTDSHSNVLETTDSNNDVTTTIYIQENTDSDDFDTINPADKWANTSIFVTSRKLFNLTTLDSRSNTNSTRYSWSSGGSSYQQDGHTSSGRTWQPHTGQSVQTTSGQGGQPEEIGGIWYGRTSPLCHFDYIPSLNKCIYIHSSVVTWTQAQTFCDRMRGKIIDFASVSEFMTFRGIVLSDPNLNKSNWHIGFWNSTDGVWKWFNSGIVVPYNQSMWATNKPSVAPNTTGGQQAAGSTSQTNGFQFPANYWNYQWTQPFCGGIMGSDAFLMSADFCQSATPRCVVCQFTLNTS